MSNGPMPGGQMPGSPVSGAYAGAAGAVPPAGISTSNNGMPTGAGVPNNGNGAGNNGKKPRKILPIIIAIIVVVALIAGGITGFIFWRNAHQKAEAKPTTTSSTTKSKPKTTTKDQQKTKSEPAKPAVTEVTMTDFSCDGNSARDWKWTGGAMVSNVIHCWDGDSSVDSDSSSRSSSDSLDGSGEYAFGIWTPSLDESKEIHVSMLESGEKEYSEPQVAATYGDNPAVFVLYVVKTKAVGTTPESVHLFAHEVDLETGELSDRIDLRTEEDNLIDYEQGYEYSLLAESRNMVAIKKTWHSDEKYTANKSEQSATINHTQVMGVTHDSDAAKVLQTFQDKIVITADSDGYQYTKQVEASASGVSLYDAYLVKDNSYHLYSVEDNKGITSFPLNYCNPNYSSCDLSRMRYLGKNIYVTGNTYDYSYVIDSTTGKQQSLKDVLGLSKDEDVRAVDQFSDGTLYVQTDGNGNESKRVFLLSSDLKPTEVLDGPQWGRLLLTDGSFKGINYLTKTIYVKTTDEQIIVDAQGKSVGKYTQLPLNDDSMVCDHSVMEWMAWSPESSGDMIATIGQAPGDPAPDLSNSSSQSESDSDSSDSESDSTDSSDSSSSSSSSSDNKSDSNK
nr:zinc ribbon domain-containing protein [Bifidobacterium longum]